MSGFTVEPEVLETFAGTSDGRAADLSRIRQTMGDIRVSPDGFGHIPFLGSHIYDVYDEHVSSCEEAVTEAAGAMSAVASGIRAVVAAYLEGDRAAGQDAVALQRALDSVRFGEGS